MLSSVNFAELLPSNVLKWLPKQFHLAQVENHLANKAIYPTVFATTTNEFLIDQAIVKETLRLNQPQFYDLKLKRIYIPQNLIDVWPDIKALALLFVEVYQPQPLATFILRGTIGKSLGTYIKPTIIEPGGEMEITLSATQQEIGKSYKLKTGQLSFIELPQEKAEMRFYSENANLIGAKRVELEIAGGQIGLIIDSRK